MSRDFRRVAILGLGLLGGSVAAGARRRGLADCVVASSRSQEPLRRALAEGLVDEIGDVASSVRGADLVVLATPVGAMPALIDEAAPHLDPGAAVTDVGSIKAALAEALPALLPEGVHYVGAHPMAGGHQRGARFADPDLFEGAPCVVMSGSSAPETTVQRVADFWRSLGAEVVFRDPARHDQEVAWVSHVPHALAFAYAHALGGAPDSASELAGSGFRDFSRIAHSDPEMWSEILNTNQKSVSEVLQSFGRSLAELGSAIESGDTQTQRAFLARGQAALAAVAVESPSRVEPTQCQNVRSGDVNPEIQADLDSADPRSVENDL